MLELRAVLLAAKGTDVADATLSHFLIACGLSRKKTRHASEGAHKIPDSPPPPIPVALLAIISQLETWLALFFKGLDARSKISTFRRDVTSQRFNGGACLLAFRCIDHELG
jgi:hypothetical protein